MFISIVTIEFPNHRDDELIKYGMRNPITAMQKMQKKDNEYERGCKLATENANSNENKPRRKRCKNEIQECVRIFQVKKMVT